MSAQWYSCAQYDVYVHAHYDYRLWYYDHINSFFRRAMGCAGTHGFP